MFKNGRAIIQIVAIDQNQVIGDSETNSIPWRCKKDLAFFRNQTTGNVVIMGRTTYESLGCKPLPNRFNIVVTKDKSITNAITAETVDEAIHIAYTVDLAIYDEKRKTKRETIFILGGKQLYSSTTDKIDALVVSHIYNSKTVDETKAVKYDVIDNYRFTTSIWCPDRVTVEEDGSFLNHISVMRDGPDNFYSIVEHLYFDGFKFQDHGSNMEDYDYLVDDVLSFGYRKVDRTGTGTISSFGGNMSFLLTLGSPFYTKRKLPLKSTIGELLWFISGSDDVRLLKDKLKCSFWDEWVDDNNSIGKMYGYVWRNYNGFDQLKYVLEEMVNNPYSRRMVVDCWVANRLPDLGVQPKENPARGKMSLAPCHFSWQVGLDSIDEEKKIYRMDLKWNQRSADVALGLPINIASYYLLLELLCKAATELNKDGWKYVPYMLCCSLGDAHVYANHLDEIRYIDNRTDFKLATFECPDGIADLLLNPTEDKLVEYQQKIFNGIKNYQAHDNIPIKRNV